MLALCRALPRYAARARFGRLEEGSQSLVSMCISLFFLLWVLLFFLSYVAKIFICTREKEFLDGIFFRTTDAKANASFSFVGVVQSETG